MSTSLFEALGPVLSDRNVSQIASAVGIDEQKATSALHLALPALVAALQHNASSREGLSSLAGALDRNHDGSILDDVVGFLAGGGASDADAVLGHILGDRRDQVARSVGRSTGLDAASVVKLLSLVAPLVLGALSRARASHPGDVSDVLADATSHIQQKSPDLMSTLGSLLDADHDGSAADDLVRMAGSLSELFATR